MRLIVDVMNVLHAWRSGPEGGKAADVVALARAIRRSRFGGWDVVLVCDGTPPSGAVDPTGGDGSYEAQGCRVLFSGAGVEADEVIEALVEGPGPVRETVIVSADRRLGRAARRCGARSMGSATFVSVLVENAGARAAAPADEPDAGGSSDLPGGEVQAWLEEFGLGQGEPGAESGARRPGEEHPPSQPAAGKEAEDWLGEAQREWRISEEDLDMERWLEGNLGEGGEDGR